MWAFEANWKARQKWVTTLNVESPSRRKKCKMKIMCTFPDAFIGPCGLSYLLNMVSTNTASKAGLTPNGVVCFGPISPDRVLISES